MTAQLTSVSGQLPSIAPDEIAAARSYRDASRAVPPFDRAIALACTMRTLRGRWLNVRCKCGHSTPHPVRLMLIEQPECADRTLADVLVGLRCRGCQGRGRLTLHLCEDAQGMGSLPKSIQPGWALLLHDAAGPERGPDLVKAAAE